MEQQPRHKYIDLFYFLTLIIKGVSAVFEIVGGTLAYFVSRNYIVHIAALLTQDELSDDPRDKIANYLVREAHQFAFTNRTFFAIYLLSHGIVRLVLVAGLLKKKLWAYYLAFVVFGLFIIYQIYKYAHTRSVWLLVLTVFDLFFIWLVWKEYRYVEAGLKKKQDAEDTHV
jgi:uncharacterized membrane protein